jgi:hypothetical protein
LVVKPGNVCYAPGMTATLESIHQQALALSAPDRAKLVNKLLCTLPPDLEDDEDSLTIAERREAEAEADPSVMLSEEEFFAGIRPWRKQA